MTPGPRVAAGAFVLALGLLHGQPGLAHAQASCNVSLDESVLVQPGERRSCGIVVVGHDVAVARDGEVDGGVVVAFGHAAIDGLVSGSINVLGGDAAVSGRVRGDVYASGVVRLGSGARVQGNVTGGTVRADDGARVDGATVELGRGWAGLPVGERAWLGDGARLLVKVLVTLVLAGVFGALAALAWPTFVARLRTGASRGFGAGVLVGSLGLAVLAVTGAIAFAARPHAVAVWILALPAILAMVGALGVGSRLGAWLLPRRRPVTQTALGVSFVATVATVALQAGYWVFLCAGGVLTLLFGAWSIGIAVLAPFSRRPGGPSAPGRPMSSASSRVHAEAEPASTTSQRAPAAIPAPAGIPVPADLPAVEVTPLADVAPPPSARPAVAIEPIAPAGPPTAQPDAATAPSSPMPPASDPDAASALELRRIPGISPIYAHVLGAAGITSLVELAERDPDDVVACLAVPGVLGIDRATAELWVAMARRRLGR